jgi:hypothetical protein
MRKFETKALSRQGKDLVYNNFRWFAGFYLKIKKVSDDRFLCTSRKWCWSFIVLTYEDYAHER